jgi:hypothetical protein
LKVEFPDFFAESSESRGQYSILGVAGLSHLEIQI